MWEAFESERKDSIGQAISSARELLIRLIRKIGEGKTRKEKTHSILKSKTQAEFIDTFAQLVDTLYNFQSKGEHAKISTEDALFVLKITDYVVYYLLKTKAK